MTGPGRTATGWRPPSPGADFVAIILGTELLVMLLGLLPGIGDGGPALLQLAVYVVGLVIGVLRWVRYRASAPARGLLRIYLVLAMALWVLEVGRRMIGGEVMSPVFITVPVLLVLVWLRPPDGAAARWTIDMLSAVLIGVIAVSIVLEVSGLVPSWYVLRQGMPLLEGDNGFYWLPLADILGLDGRWAGPFPHPNMAGPMGGFLLVIGMCRTGWLRWASYATGIVVLLLTASRTSVIAAVAASVVTLLAILLWSRARSLPSLLSLLVAPVASGLVLVGSVVYKGAASTVAVLPSELNERFGSLTGRTSIWPVYVDIWRESPWLGSPDARIAQAQASGDLPTWAITAHNLLLDSLVRFGILGTTVVVALFVVVAVMGVGAARRGSAVSLGTVVVVLVCGIAEVLVFWRLWAASTILLFLAVIAAMEPMRADRSEPATPPAPAPVPGTDPDPDRAPTA